MMRWLYRLMNERYVSRLFLQREFETAFGADTMQRGRKRRAF
jgi:hypothetical protein